MVKHVLLLNREVVIVLIRWRIKGERKEGFARYGEGLFYELVND